MPKYFKFIPPKVFPQAPTNSALGSSDESAKNIKKPNKIIKDMRFKMVIPCDKNKKNYTKK
ncbi:hypothetical protein LBC_09750 [Campylobacter sp. 19-13652]|nr:hypothetical protein LBC_09750 [Campylobacter sp. 19-13652]